MSSGLDLARASPAGSGARIASATVAVLMGGRSGEREVSLATGRNVASALRERDAPDDRRGPERVVAIELGEDGRWELDGEALHPTEAVLRLPPETVFFLGLHGGEGENGIVQGFLEHQGRAHTGSCVAASALCMDKHATRAVLSEAGIEVAPGRRVHPVEWRARRAELASELRRLSTSGWYVKPNSGGSSVDTVRVGGATDLEPAVDRVLATGDLALVEACVLGSEATCGVLGNHRGELTALPPVEIVPRAGRFFDYEEKYSPQGAEELCPPRSLTPRTSARLCELAVRAHRATGCDGYSRTDFIVPRDADGHEREPVALEVNTLPGLTGRSLLPKAARAAGWSYRDLCLAILALAVEPRARGGELDGQADEA